MNCPCGENESYGACCGRYIDGGQQPETALALMRSRYTAFVKGKMEYIRQTHDPKTRANYDFLANEQWAKSSEWLGLEILTADQGQAGDVTGTVEFKARFVTEGEEQIHHELSQFRKVGDQWYFSNGKDPSRVTIVREGDKIGRNDPCPCGSEKKYKKCCGKAS